MAHSGTLAENTALAPCLFLKTAVLAVWHYFRGSWGVPGGVPGVSQDARSDARLYTAWQPPLQVLVSSKAASSPRSTPRALGALGLNRRQPPSGGFLGGRYTRPYTGSGLLEPRTLLPPPAVSVPRCAQPFPIRERLARISSLPRGGWYEDGGLEAALKRASDCSSWNKFQEQRASFNRTDGYGLPPVSSKLLTSGVLRSSLKFSAIGLLRCLASETADGWQPAAIHPPAVSEARHLGRPHASPPAGQSGTCNNMLERGRTHRWRCL